MAYRLILQSLLAILLVSALGASLAQAQDYGRNFEGYFTPWTWNKSDCQNCPVIFQSAQEDMQSKKVKAFMRALETSKFEIIKLYHSDPQEYNLLAHMAIGILGRESRFFKSWRYFAKEEMQWSVSLIKSMRVFLSGDEDKVSQNSRGPTQIKIVPELIAERYGINPDNLSEPQNSARATMGFLIEALRELKQKKKINKLDFVTKETYTDYLPYIYFGASGQLLKHTATPATNVYVKSMKSYMAWVKVYEFHPTNP